VLTGTDPSDAARTVTLALTVSASTTVAATSAGATGATGRTGTGAGSLAFTGSMTRDLLSISLLLVAVGLFVLGEASRRRAAQTR
jgi:hypothetical protein